jgi:poly-gamma-glutamate synthesis protein (capsule biosynthesis protein)
MTALRRSTVGGYAKAIEIYRSRPILYGCGDFLNDYEGISGKEEYRDLAVMYLPRLATPDGQLIELLLEVFRIRKFRLHRASREDPGGCRRGLTRGSRRFGTRAELREGNRLAVVW